MRILLDPGHGGPDRGGNHLPGLDEAALNLVLANLIRKNIQEQSNIEVFLTREDDLNPSLANRVALIDVYSANIFISVHANSANSVASGVETYVQYSNTVSHTLGRSLHDVIVAVTGLGDRGVRVREYAGDIFQLSARPPVTSWGQDYYAVLRTAKIPAVLLEVGFLDNPTDSKILNDQQIQTSIGERIAQSILAWNRERSPSNTEIPVLDSAGNSLTTAFIMEKNGLAYVQLREFAEALGLVVTWNEIERNITLKWPGVRGNQTF